ncbi:hypothetical protein BATDEDRAFT_91793 [Batrachochytrium dendrobatidis JAM81]|uniref:Uncharacterized protein n=2 Tax=Batrachochytrium dendrobatidis TaxID=109871 RepID=F4PB98_BATDJ|nr:uncharacterized protein BATDEDRAFT_91793 [Batrachochytrium dendrobatidis JAM81]EGF77405.1 hypothetical protein BATDEDRAFT_91793 [Batrachochytrium dendrobatidis JAM81]OAJ37910.1 hypothetical protein BDEG_21880 [Batrachochytrium dendrobatidis JEL423]|eukprot:XP_006682066.1 hypothetical protein BATDEDRAFT_91793 [Batrachochytrium dendrobatidis JAM81]
MRGQIQPTATGSRVSGEVSSYKLTKGTASSALERAQAMLNAASIGNSPNTRRTLGSAPKSTLTSSDLAPAIRHAQSISHHQPQSYSLQRQSLFTSNDGYTDSLSNNIDHDDFISTKSTKHGRAQTETSKDGTDDNEDAELKAYLASLKTRQAENTASHKPTSASISSPAEYKRNDKHSSKTASLDNPQIPHQKSVSSAPVQSIKHKLEPKHTDGVSSTPATPVSSYLKKTVSPIKTTAISTLEKSKAVGDIETDSDSVSLEEDIENNDVKLNIHFKKSGKRVSLVEPRDFRLSTSGHMSTFGTNHTLLQSTVSAKDLDTSSSHHLESADSIGSDFEAFLNMRSKSLISVNDPIVKLHSSPNVVQKEFFVSSETKEKSNVAQNQSSVITSIMPHDTVAIPKPVAEPKPVVIPTSTSIKIMPTLVESARHETGNRLSIANTSFTVSMKSPNIPHTSSNISDDILEEFLTAEDADISEDISSSSLKKSLQVSTIEDPHQPIVTPSIVPQQTQDTAILNQLLNKDTNLTKTINLMPKNGIPIAATKATAVTLAQAVVPDVFELANKQHLEQPFVTNPLQHALPSGIAQPHISVTQPSSQNFPHYAPNNPYYPQPNLNFTPANFHPAMYPNSWNAYTTPPNFLHYGIYQPIHPSGHTQPNPIFSQCSGYHACGCCAKTAPKPLESQNKSGLKADVSAVTNALDHLNTVLQNESKTHIVDEKKFEVSDSRHNHSSRKESESEKLLHSESAASLHREPANQNSIYASQGIPTNLPTLMILDSFTSNHMDLLQDFVRMNMQMADSQSYRRMHYTTLDDVRQFALKNRPPIIDINEALLQVKEDAGEISVGRLQA